MNEFLLIFRADYASPATAEQMKEATQRWMDWMSEIRDAGQLKGRSRLTNEGRVIKGGGIIINGPYTEIKETIGGYAHILAESFDAAVAIGQRCPNLQIDGGTVEVREML